MEDISTVEAAAGCLPLPRFGQGIWRPDMADITAQHTADSAGSAARLLAFLCNLCVQPECVVHPEPRSVIIIAL